MGSRSFQDMVRFFADDASVRNQDIDAALCELDEEFRLASVGNRPIPLDRYRLRKILRAAARARGLSAGNG
jgi:hypothetical protein